MQILKFILAAIVFIFLFSLGLMFLPAIIGIFIGVLRFQEGRIAGGILAIAIGLICQAILFLFIHLDDGSGSFDDEECPICGSGDTDGNHCYDCGDEF